jgi:hypothetical protein
MMNSKIVDKNTLFSSSLLPKQCLSVADNARDAVLFHVSASNERQERRKEKDAMKKTTERHVVAQRRLWLLLSCDFI